MWIDANPIISKQGRLVEKRLTPILMREKHCLMAKKNSADGLVASPP